ncbi:MAG TPA: trans-aconitate 2-methyltransferase [Methylovirgula sp.]|nr:trans-aconitate 2-methyltransferase [Methylovirgula sp.]
MSNWDPSIYLKYADERTRPARDLLSQVPRAEVARAYDLGCGPGNSTALIAARFPGADIIGVDSSAEMLEEARRALPDVRFQRADLATWRPEFPAELLFGNAVFQWLPDHLDVFEALLAALPAGGVLAVQMPDNLDEPSHVLMREIAAERPWAEKLAAARVARQPLPAPSVYYDRLAPLCRHVDIWHTIYNYRLAGASAIIEWVKGSGLRPYLEPLGETERRAFLDTYRARLATAYPARNDGRVLFPFPRLFLVAVRA